MSELENLAEIERRLDDIRDEIVELQDKNEHLKSARKLIWRAQIMLAIACEEKLKIVKGGEDDGD